MSNITYLHSWKPELCIQLDTSENHLADFNRFMVKGFPSTASLQKGERFEDANREGFILQIKSRFNILMGEGKSIGHCTPPILNALNIFVGAIKIMKRRSRKIPRKLTLSIFMNRYC